MFYNVRRMKLKELAALVDEFNRIARKAGEEAERVMRGRGHIMMCDYRDQLIKSELWEMGFSYSFTMKVRAELNKRRRLREVMRLARQFRNAIAEIDMATALRMAWSTFNKGGNRIANACHKAEHSDAPEILSNAIAHALASVPALEAVGMALSQGVTTGRRLWGTFATKCSSGFEDAFRFVMNPFCVNCYAGDTIETRYNRKTMQREGFLVDYAKSSIFDWVENPENLLGMRGIIFDQLLRFLRFYAGHYLGESTTEPAREIAEELSHRREQFMREGEFY